MRESVVNYLKYCEQTERELGNTIERTKTDREKRIARANVLQTVAYEIQTAHIE